MQLKLISIIVITTLSGCVSNQIAERPVDWPQPTKLTSNACLPINGMYLDVPIARQTAANAKAETSLTGLMRGHILDGEGLPYSVISGKNIRTELNISTDFGAVINTYDNQTLLMTMRVDHDNIACENGALVIKKKSTYGNEGRSTKDESKLFIWRTDNGELITQSVFLTHQSSILVIHTFSKRENWARFQPINK